MYIIAHKKKMSSQAIALTAIDWKMSEDRDDIKEINIDFAFPENETVSYDSEDDAGDIFPGLVEIDKMIITNDNKTTRRSSFAHILSSDSINNAFDEHENEMKVEQSLTPRKVHGSFKEAD